MRGLVTEGQEVLIVPQNINGANKGKVAKVNAGEFLLEVENEPKYLLENTYCEFYTQSDRGKIFFESYAKNIKGKELLIASPAKHKFLQRRQYTRIKYTNESELSSLDKNYKVFTLDISAGGLKFKTKEALNIDGTYMIEIPITSNKKIKCKFQPIRIEKNNNEYITSGQFIYNKSIDKMLLIQFCTKRSFEIRNK